MQPLRILMALGIASFAPASAQVVFGPWWDNGTTSAEYDVQAGGFGSITNALAAAIANGDIGNVPVTINVEFSTYNVANGETFPITLPAHGVTIEATDLGFGGPLPIVEAMSAPSTPNEVFLFDTVGNEDLPRSVIRGLRIGNNTLEDGTGACIRIAAVSSGGTGARELVAPEIRRCDLFGLHDIGIDVQAQLGTTVVPLIERNTIRAGKGDLDFGIRIDAWPFDFDPDEVPEDEWPLVSPFVRSNTIRDADVNVGMFDLGYFCRPRLWSNFISRGETNVYAEGCAPAILNNTIAFAVQPAGGNAFGLSLVNVPELFLTNNCLWNPDIGTSIGVDVAFTPSYPTTTIPFFNFDEDGTLLSFGPNYDLTAMPTAPGFVSSTDLHLAGGSPMIGMGIQAQPFGTDVAPNFMTVGSGSNVFPARLDNAYDIDFDSRTTAVSVDVGADEYIEIDAQAFTRGTRLAAHPSPVIGSVAVPALDTIGNLEVDSTTNIWRTQVQVFGTPGDIFALVAGTGYFDTTVVSGTAIDERYAYHHTFNPAGFPAGDVGIDFSSSLTNVTVAIGVIGASGFTDVDVNFAPFALSTAEGEVYLQALTTDFTFAESSERLQVDLDG